MNLKNVLAGVIAVMTIAGAVYGATELFARKTEVQLIAARLDQKIMGDQAAQIQNRIWRIEDRFGKDCQRCDDDTKKEWRRLKDQLYRLNKQLDVIYKQMKGGG